MSHPPLPPSPRKPRIAYAKYMVEGVLYLKPSNGKPDICANPRKVIR